MTVAGREPVLALLSFTALLLGSPDLAAQEAYTITYVHSYQAPRQRAFPFGY